MTDRDSHPAHRRTATALVAATSLLALVACRSGGSAADIVQSPGITTVPAGATVPPVAAATGGDVTSLSTLPAPTTVPLTSPTTVPETADTPLATAEVVGSVFDNRDRPVRGRIDVLRLDRGPNSTVRLQFRVTALDGDLEIYGLFAVIINVREATSIIRVNLIDLVHDQRYLVLTDSNGDCVCSTITGGQRVLKGQSFVLAATFPAPPADVKALDLDLVATQIANVPLGAGNG